MSTRTKLFVGITVSLGMAVLCSSVWHWQSADPTRLVCYLVVAVLASSLKVQLPGIDGTMSVNFLFILLGVMELSLPETLLIGCTATLVQSIWHARNRLDPVKVLFNVFGMMANASALCYVSYHWLDGRAGNNKPILLMIAALVFFLANTLPISVVIALTENKSSRKVWKECYFWSFPYYLVGAAAVGLVGIINQRAGWQTSLLVLPVIYWVYRSYRLYLGRLEAEKERVEVEKRHVEQIASLNMRTIEALALAIEAKDHTTHTHLQRVRTYAVEIAREIGLSADEIEALRAAALLHDIGKLAVPENIINKPGRLTPEEFEKMKVHPLVGAEILDRVAFPYPVAPIVRSHHERWDGSGYPAGLAGEEIPIGARILAVVDCLDALASDRQYRQAMPLDRAMDRVKERAGTWFDPKIVEVLERRYVDLERIAQSYEDGFIPRGFSRELRVERGLAPATGFEKWADSSQNDSDFLTSIASARQEAQAMFELSQDLGNSLSLSETLSVLSMRLRKLIPYDSIAVFVNRNGWLLPELVSGENFRVLSSLKIRVGEGLCGWVAENCKPIINGNPQVEAGYVADPENRDSGFGAGGSIAGIEWRGGRAGHVSLDPGRVYAGPLADSAGRGFEGGPLGRERPEVSAGGKFGDYGLPYRVAQRALAVRAPGAGSDAMPAHEDFARRDGLRHRRTQEDQRFLRASGRRQTAARVQHAAEGCLPRLRLRRAHGWRRVCDHGTRTHHRSCRGKNNPPERGGYRSGTAHLRKECDQPQRGNGVLSRRRV